MLTRISAFIAVVGLLTSLSSAHVVEVAQHPCCWKGPRVRRLSPNAAPVTLLTIDDGNHLHIWPSDRPLQWLFGAVGAVTVLGVAGIWRLRCRGKRLAA